MPFTPLPSLREIAERCGVARSSVGHILGGRDHLFKPETRDLVLRAAEEMGWKRPSDWRAVRRARFGCAVLLQSLIANRSYMATSFLAAIEDRLLDRNMHLTLARLPDETLASETGLRRLLTQWSADGLLINYTQDVPPRMRELVAGLDLPAVWVNSPEPIDAVRPDDHAAGHTAASLLLEAGHRHIAYLGFVTPPAYAVHYSFRERPDGARTAVAAAGGTFVEVPGPDRQTVEAWRKRLAKRGRETAVICYGPLQVLPVLHAALELGLRVPGDLSLVTFHDETLSLLDHEIASLKLPYDALAERIVRHLCDRIAGEPPAAIAPLPFVVHSTATIAQPAPSRRRRAGSQQAAE